MNFKKKNAANAPAPNQAQQAARRRSLRSGAYASVLAVVVLVLVNSAQPCGGRGAHQVYPV